ncbi:MAG TPA: conjugal transfer protein TraF [Thermodesulfobacteriota bacterium]|nr:conjugal transfer protein TraF [Thermodesulfobacteriota bacterium]
MNAVDAQLATSNASGVSPAEATTRTTALAGAFAGGGSLEANASWLHNRGLGLLGIPLSYGRPVGLGALGTLGLGASVKALVGRVYLSEVRIFALDSGDIVQAIRETYRDSSAFGVDAGILWRPAGWLAVGVVGKNLNAPTFEAPAGPELALEPAVRAGLAVSPRPWLAVLADVDLTENETALAGYRSRHLGGGLEIRPAAWFGVRAGAYTNLAERDIGPVLTAGLAPSASRG